MIPQTFILICLIFITSCNENKKNGDLSNTKEVSDSSLYADIDMFQLKGIDKIDTPGYFPNISIKKTIGDSIRITYRSTEKDSFVREYTLINKIWTTSYEHPADTGYEKVYEYILPEKIIELYYFGDLERKNYHLHDAAVINKNGATIYGFGGEKGLNVVPNPDRLNDVKKMAQTFMKDSIFEKNRVTYNIWERIDTPFEFSKYQDTVQYNVSGRSWHWIKAFGWTLK